MTPTLLRLLLVLALTLPLAGCFGKSPEQRVEAAKQALQKSDTKTAIVELKSALQKEPVNGEARLLLGQAYYAADAYQNAEKELSKARDQGIGNERVLPLLAMTLLRERQAQKVLDLGLPPASLSPQATSQLYVARGEALLALGKRPEAEQALAAAAQRDANLPELLLVKARLALADRKVPEAMQDLDKALQRDAKFTDALFLKAGLLQEQGKPDEAMKIYQQVIANDPNKARAHLAMAGLHLKAKNTEAADQDIKAAEKIAPNNPMVEYARGTLELQRGNLDKASSALLNVLRAAPDHMPSELAYAMASYGLGHYEESAKAAGKVYGAVPDNLMAAKILAGSQLKIGDIQGALKTLEPLLSKHAEDAKLLALAGQAYLQAKDYNKAMGYLDKAAELDPENAGIKTSQAASQLATGNTNAALADLESATRLSDKPGQADVALVMMHLQNKEYDQALQAIASLEKKLPNNPVTHNLRAAVLLGKQDSAGARKEFEQALAIQPSFFPAAINLARLDMQDNKPEAARKRFESILAADKNNVKAMLALADLATANKNENDTVAWLEKAIKADPKVLPAYVGLIRHDLAKKENAKALAQAKEAASANPDSLAALNLLASTQLATGDKDAAIDTYAHMTQKAPQSPEAYRLLALAQIADNQLESARNSLNTALQLKPDFLKAQDALIQLDLAEKRPDAATAVARQIQTQLPKSPLGFDREAFIQLSQKKYPLAIHAYEEALVKGAGPIGLIKLHKTLVLSGNAKSAEQRLTIWLEQNPKDVTVRTYAAEYYTSINRNRDAITQYEQILKLTPGNALILNNLANLYWSEKDARALAVAEQAMKFAPEQASVQDTLGWILLGQGQTARGLDLLRSAVRKLPMAATLHYHYAVALARAGNKSEAKNELERALKSEQHFPELDEAKGMLRNL